MIGGRRSVHRSDIVAVILCGKHTGGECEDAASSNRHGRAGLLVLDRTELVVGLSSGGDRLSRLPDRSVAGITNLTNLRFADISHGASSEGRNRGAIPRTKDERCGGRTRNDPLTRI